MELKEQVCSLELAERLKELKVRQDAQFWWIDRGEGYRLEVVVTTGKSTDKECAAFTVAELGEMLRNDGIDIGFNVMSDSAQNGHRVWLADPENDQWPWTFDDDSTFMEVTEADARAKMLIYLIKNRLI